jgi:hypothetical protein
LITCVSGGDGEAAIRGARINRTFKAGTPVKEILKALAASLNIGAGNLNSIGAVAYADGTTAIRRALTCAGLTYDELEDHCRSCGLRWSVQDSALQLRRGDAPVGDTQGPLLRADSGLIGKPQVETDKKGTLVSGTCLLRADLIPGVPFRVESDAFEGNLVAIATQHDGDSHQAQPWYVNWTGRPYGN